LTKIEIKYIIQTKRRRKQVMNIRISGKEVKATDAIKEYINKKVGRLEKFFGENADITVTIRNEKNMQIAEMQIIHNGGITYRAEAKEQDLYASIDKDLDIIEGQLRKSKAKKEKMNKEDSIRFKDDLKSEKESRSIENEITKVIAYDVKPMSPEDAKLKMEDMPKEMFLTFVNIATGKVNVIYRLKDKKNYGVVEPEV